MELGTGWSQQDTSATLQTMPSGFFQGRLRQRNSGVAYDDDDGHDALHHPDVGEGWGGRYGHPNNSH